MRFWDEHRHDRTIIADDAITLANLNRLAANVELAGAMSDSVIADLSHTQTVDSWGFLMLLRLNEHLAPRLIFVAPPYLREALELLHPRTELRVFSTLEEARLAA